MTTETDVTYETKSVKTVRGLEARTRANLEKEGWEFVSQAQGTVRSELTFRRPKPGMPWKKIGVAAGMVAFVLVVLAIAGVFEAGGSAGDEDVATPSSSTPSISAPTESRPPSPEPAPTPTRAPAPAVTVTDITVDALLDRLNSAEMGGIEVGDQFRLTGELFMSELWMTGATGDFFVMLKAQGGSQDLSVFVDESDAAGWQDGTEVEMVIEMVEATINGETTDGWLRARSVKTLL